MTGILIAVAVVAGVGIVIGILLGVAGEKFKVEVDEKEIAVRELLPGNNCGGCGYPGCDGLAAAIAKGEMPPSACPVGGEQWQRRSVRLWAWKTRKYKVCGICSSVQETARRQRMYTSMLAQETVNWHRTIPTTDQRHVHTDVQVMVHVRQYVSSGLLTL